MSWTLCSKEQVTKVYKIPLSSLDDFWSDTVESMIRGYLRAPYLGLSETIITEKHSGDNTPVMSLNNVPVTGVSSISVRAGSALAKAVMDSNRYDIITTGVALIDGTVFPKGILNIEVTYTTGGVEVPSKVSLAAATMIASIAIFEGRAGADGSLKYGDLPVFLGGDTSVKDVGMVTYLKYIMTEMLDKYQVRIR